MNVIDARWKEKCLRAKFVTNRTKEATKGAKNVRKLQIKQKVMI